MTQFDNCMVPRTVHHIINDAIYENGGAQQIVRHLHEGSLAKGINSQVVALVGEEADYPDNHYRSFELSTPYGIGAFAKVLHYIRGNCSKEDIIHAHLFPTLLYVSMAVRICRYGGRIICTEHSTSNRRRQSRVGKNIDRLVYPGYDRIYCISRGTYESLAAWMPGQKEKLKVIENGALLPIKRFILRAINKKLIIVSVGRLHRLKNYETALHALSRLENVEFEYRIAGTGPEEKNLIKLCNQLGLDECVRFCGYVNDIFCFLREADIFLIPSRWEGFGLAAVEAMNTGLPVIASNVIGLKEIINTENPCGILVSPDSADEIADAVRVLLEPEKRAVFGKNAFKRSMAFSKERMVDSYIAEYTQGVLHTGK